MAQNQVLYKFRSVYEREKDDDKSGWKSILFIGDEIKCESCVDKIRKDCGLPDNTTVLLYNAGDQSRPWKDDSHKGYKDSQQISKDTKLVAKKKPVDIAVSDAARGLGEMLEEPHQIPDPTGIPRNRLKLVADDADLGGAQFYIIGGKKYVFESQIGYFERYIKEKDHLRRLDGRGQGRAKNAAYAHAPAEDPVLREHFPDYRHPFDFLRLYLPGLAKVNNPMKAAYLLPHKNFRPAPPRVQPPPVIRPPPIALPPPPVSAPSSQVAEGVGSDSRVDDRTSRGVARDRDASRTDERESSFSKQDKDRSSTGDRNDRDWDERGARSRDEGRDRERERDRNRDRDRDRDKGGRERGGDRSPKRSRR